MRLIQQFLTFGCLAVCAIGCASSGPKYSELKSAGTLTPKDNNGMIVIYRTPGVVGVAYKPYVYVNDAALGKIARGGFFAYEATPGLNVLACSDKLGESNDKTKAQAAIGGAIAGGLVGVAVSVPMDKAARRKHELNINVVPGQTHLIVWDGRLKESSKGDTEVDSCRWLNPSIGK